mgnify:CR=1 FL=1
MDDENKIEVSPARQAVDYAMSGDATNFKNAIDSMLYTKVADAISVKKHDVASSMFGDETIGDVADETIGSDDEEIEDEVETSEEEADFEEPVEFEEEETEEETEVEEDSDEEL